LVEVTTGKVLQTTFSIAPHDEITGLQANGWSFDWADEDLCYCNIYKLQLKDDNIIQGLVAAEVVRGAVYVHLAESAPHNLSKNKQYEGVGGHLFAIAMKLSMVNGFGGYIFFDAKNLELVKHYSNMLGAVRVLTRIHDYRMEVYEEQAEAIIDKYALEGDLNVE
jgi:hypothetical protein